MSRLAQLRFPMTFRIITDGQIFIVEHSLLAPLGSWGEEKSDDGEILIFKTLDAAREYKKRREQDEADRCVEKWRVIE